MQKTYANQTYISTHSNSSTRGKIAIARCSLTLTKTLMQKAIYKNVTLQNKANIVGRSNKNEIILVLKKAVYFT